jgi:UDP-glucuronate decarboxylase
VKVARIFNTYGPRMHPNDGRVVSNFIMQALADQPLTIYGDGTQTRSFCYVDDMIRGFDSLMQSPDDMFGPVNLGNPVEHTMLELAERIIALSNSRSTIEFKPLPSDDPVRRRPDITLARKALQWEPKVSLSEGLGKTIEYFRELRQTMAEEERRGGSAGDHADNHVDGHDGIDGALREQGLHVAGISTEGNVRAGRRSGAGPMQ